MTKICLITDTHFGARNDSPVFLKYFDKFYYEVFFPYLEEHGIKTIFHLGDIVERRKYINFLSCRHLNKFVKTCSDKSIELNVIIGNHDAFLKNSNDINSMNELFTDSKYNVNYYSEAQTVNVNGLDIALLPWINSGNYQSSMEFIKETSAQIAFGHLEVAGFAMYKGSTNDHGFDRKIFDKFDMVMTGHFHHRSSDGHIFYLGAPYEITWSDWSDERGFHIFDTETRELTYIKNPFSIFHKIIYNETENPDIHKQDFSFVENCYVKVVVQDKVSDKSFGLFQEKLESYNPIKLQIIEDSVNIEFNGEELSLDTEDTISIIKKEIETMEVSVSKDLLKGMLTSIWQEAIMQE